MEVSSLEVRPAVGTVALHLQLRFLEHWAIPHVGPSNSGSMKSAPNRDNWKASMRYSSDRVMVMKLTQRKQSRLSCRHWEPAVRSALPSFAFPSASVPSVSGSFRLRRRLGPAAEVMNETM